MHDGLAAHRHPSLALEQLLCRAPCGAHAGHRPPAREERAALLCTPKPLPERQAETSTANHAKTHSDKPLGLIAFNKTSAQIKQILFEEQHLSSLILRGKNDSEALSGVPPCPARAGQHRCAPALHRDRFRCVVRTIWGLFQPWWSSGQSLLSKL